MNRNIEVNIDGSGDVTIDAKGFSGMACIKATEFLEQTLGTLGRRRCKAEFSQTELNLQTLSNPQD